MPINPSSAILPIIAQLSQRPTILGSLAESIGGAAKNYMQLKALREQQGAENTMSLLKSFNLRPSDPNRPAQGPTFGDLLKLANRGSTPGYIPPEMLTAEAVPISDVNALTRLLPSIINAQAPNSKTPLQGDQPGALLEPGTIPGVKADVSVQGKQPPASADRSGKLNSIFGQASNASRGTISQRITQAMADPQSANVKNFPILDAKVARQEWLKQFKAEATIRGASEEEIESRMKAVEKEFDDEDTSFEKDLQQALRILKQKPDFVVTAKKTLMEQYPMHRARIMAEMKVEAK